MSDEDQWTRRSLARMVEAGLHFFGVANLEQFEGLLDDAQQRAMLRAILAAHTRLCAANMSHVVLLRV